MDRQTAGWMKASFQLPGRINDFPLCISLFTYPYTSQAQNLLCLVLCRTPSTQHRAWHRVRTRRTFELTNELIYRQSPQFGPLPSEPQFPHLQWALPWASGSHGDVSNGSMNMNSDCGHPWSRQKQPLTLVTSSGGQSQAWHGSG